MRWALPLLCLLACGDADDPATAVTDSGTDATTPSGTTGPTTPGTTDTDTSVPTTTPPGATADTGTTTVTTGCAYPAGAVDPMTEGEVIPAFAWPEARHMGTGAVATLDLGQVPCAVDDDIDWSPFDVLLFVSIPAW